MNKNDFDDLNVLRACFMLKLTNSEGSLLLFTEPL